MFARRHRIAFAGVADFVAPLTPVGLALGRLGNFIGQELWGRPTDVPWAMIFPRDPLALARHPSALSICSGGVPAIFYCVDLQLATTPSMVRRWRVFGGLWSIEVYC